MRLKKTSVLKQQVDIFPKRMSIQAYLSFF